MELLTFAHKKEADAFLTHFSYEKVGPPHLLKTDSHYLLITGEGLFQALYKISKTISLLSRELKAMVNYGVAGVLEDHLALNQLYKVRTIYAAESEHKMKFQSYSTESSLQSSTHYKELDCVSYIERVTDPKVAQRLSHFASLVDKELWALAFACHKSQIPFTSFKWGFDRASSQEICEQKFEFSHHFLENYQNLKTKKVLKDNSLESFFHSNSSFYFTFSQREKLKSLVKALKKKYHNFDLKSFPLESYKKESGKKKAQRLIESLKAKLTPETHQIEQNLKSLNQELFSSGAQINFSPNFETEDIEIKFKINKSSNFSQFKKALDNWPYKDVQRVLRGKN